MVIVHAALPSRGAHLHCLGGYGGSSCAGQDPLASRPRIGEHHHRQSGVGGHHGPVGQRVGQYEKHPIAHRTAAAGSAGYAYRPGPTNSNPLVTGSSRARAIKRPRGARDPRDVRRTRSDARTPNAGGHHQNDQTGQDGHRAGQRKGAPWLNLSSTSGEDRDVERYEARSERPRHGIGQAARAGPPMSSPYC